MPMKPVGWSSSACRTRAATAGICGPFQSAAVVVFVLDPSRAPRCARRTFGGRRRTCCPSTVDRWQRLQSTAASEERSHPAGVLLERTSVAISWAWPTEQEWAFGWVTAIGELYHLNDRRLEVREDSEAFQQRDPGLRAAVAALSSSVGKRPRRNYPCTRRATQSAVESAGTLARADVIRRAS